MPLTINPRALMHDQTELKIGISEGESGRGYVSIRAALGLSRAVGLMAIGPVNGLGTPMPGDLEHDLPGWCE